MFSWLTLFETYPHIINRPRNQVFIFQIPSNLHVPSSKSYNSYGFPMIFPLKPPFSYGFPMIFPGSWGSPKRIPVEIFMIFRGAGVQQPRRQVPQRRGRGLFRLSAALGGEDGDLCGVHALPPETGDGEILVVSNPMTDPWCWYIY